MRRPSPSWRRTLALVRRRFPRLIDGCKRGGNTARPGGGISPGSPAVPGYAVNVDAGGNVRWQHSYVPNGDLDPEVVGLAVLSDGSTVLAVRSGYEQFDSASGLQNSIDANPVFAAKSDGSMQVTAMAGGPADTITFVGSYTGSVNFDFDGVAASVGTYSSTNPLPRSCRKCPGTAAPDR